MGLKLWAVTVGIAVDICGSIIIGIVAFISTADGESLNAPIEMQERFGSFGLALMLVVGIAQTGLGAFVAGRMAKVHYVRHGLAVGLFALVFGVLSGIGGNDGMPDWYNPISYAAVLPVSALGGYLASGVPNRD